MDMRGVRLDGLVSGSDRGTESGGPVLLGSSLQLRGGAPGVHRSLVGLYRRLVRSLAVLRSVGLVGDLSELLLSSDDSLKRSDTLGGARGRGSGGLLLGDGLLEGGLTGLLTDLITFLYRLLLVF